MMDDSQMWPALRAALAADRSVEYRHGVLDLASGALFPGMERAQALVRLNNAL